MATLKQAALGPAAPGMPRAERCITGRRISLANLLALFVCSTFQGEPAQTTESPTAISEYRFKAEFLYHFAKLVEWPTNAFASANSPITIGILGRDPFGALMDDLLNNKKIEGRPVQVKKFERVEDVRACHVLFISGSEERRIPPILSWLSGKSILTVGESPNFLEQGGVIQFVLADDRVRFQVRLRSADHQQLKLSSKLLFLSKPLYRPPVKGLLPP